jgi:myo-inositol 2-dehydrogenase/D-chiro-inositol 1-dehydrogenase
VIRFGLAGGGRIGTVHARNIAACRDPVLARISDPDRGRAVAIAEATGASVSGSFDELLSDASIDAVVIASPTELHAEQAAAAARAGKAVLCEKPLSLAIDRARSCAAAVATAGVPFMVAFNKRFDPDIAELAIRVRRRDIGRVELISFVGKDPESPPEAYIATSGSIFHDMMIHDIDLALFIAGEAPVDVFATGTVQVSEAFAQASDFDTAAVVMKTASGMVITQTLSRCATYGFDQRIEVHGSAGMLRTLNHHADAVESLDVSGVGRSRLQHSFIERYAASYAAEVRYFIDALESRAAIALDANHALRVQAIADGLKQSARSGLPVRLVAGS